MADRPDRVGQQLGNYRLIRLLGEGGFAEVYLGEHIYLKTQVAVKVLQEKIETQYVEGFLKEAQTIAALKHPHILRVLDFGMENARPFLVMEYASGGTLRQKHPRGSKVPLPTVISYAKQVTMALQYAHDQKIVHRDVKPENMLVEADGKIVLGDFGIAIPAHKTQSLSTQEAVGTVSYMAPEQIQGKPRAASDQYSLGVIIYEWLSGARPFEGTTAIEIAMHHLTDPPPPLREKVPTIAAEVEQVLMTALAKDPKQRFASVQAFATALEQANQSGQNLPSLSSVEVTRASQPLSPTVPATPPNQSSSEPIMVPANYSLALEQANQPEQKHPSTPLPEATQSNHPTILITPPNLPNPSMEPTNDDPPLSYVFDAPKEPDTQQLIHQPTRYPSRRTVIAGLAGLALVSSGIIWFTSSRISTPTPILTPTPLPIGTTLYTYKGHSDAVRTVAWSPDGKRIASGGYDSTVQVWDAVDGGHVYTYKGHSDIVWSVAWSPDGKRIASGSNDMTMHVWDAANGNDVFTSKKDISKVHAVAWSPDGKRIASGGRWRGDIWYVANGGNTYIYGGLSADDTDMYYSTSLSVSQLLSVAWSPDGNRIASGYEDTRGVFVWDLAHGSNTIIYKGHSDDIHSMAWHPDGIYSVAWSPDSKRIASGSSDHTVQVWDATDGNHVYTYKGHSDIVQSVAWSPDGKRIASASSDHTVQVWNATDGGHVYTYKGHFGDVFSVAWSPNGKYIASGSQDYRVQVWVAS